MNKLRRTLRWIAALSAVLALSASILFLFSMQSNFDALKDSKRAGPLWIATQLQSEFLRFDTNLSKYLSGRGNINADDIRFRFDILWSRAAIALKGQANNPAAEASESFAKLQHFMSFLKSVDASIQDLEDGDRTVLLPLADALSRFSSSLQDYTLAAKEEQSLLDAKARGSYQNLSRDALVLAAIVGFASLASATLFYMDFVQQEKLANKNRELADSAQAGIAAKSEFISTISHELRTPLTSIKGALAILEAGHAGVLSDKAKRITSIALRNSNRLTRLINDILDFERIEMDKMNYRCDPFILNDALHNAVADNASFMQEYGVEIVSEIPDEEAVVDGDQIRIEQVLSNLLSNAIKFSPERGQVIVRLVVSEFAVITVQDFGIGIAKDFHEKLFDRFSQADSSDTRQFGGSGLGLNIAKSITEAHHGKICFESSLGVGSTFFLELPLSEQSAALDAVA